MPRVVPMTPHMVMPVIWATKQVRSEATVSTNWQRTRLPAARATASKNLGTISLRPTAGWGSIQMS